MPFRQQQQQKLILHSDMFGLSTILNMFTIEMRIKICPTPHNCVDKHYSKRQRDTVEVRSLHTLRLELLKLVFHPLHKFLVNKQVLASRLGHLLVHEK